MIVTSFYKRLLNFFCIIFFSFFSLLSADENLYYINVDFLLNESKIGKKVIKQLEKINENNIEKIRNAEKKLIDKEKEIKTTKNIISQDEFDKKIASLKKEINDFNNFRNNLSKEFDSLKNDRLNELYQDINPLIETFMKENNINILLDKKNIFIGSQDRDITNEIIKLIDQKLN